MAINAVRIFPDLQDSYADWQLSRENVARLRFTSSVVGRKGASETIGQPKSKNGIIVCGVVSSSERYNAKLRGLDRKVLAVETESGGVFDAAKRKKIPALTIRGISDHADDAKEQ